MNLASTIALLGYGTSQGAEKAWDTRGRGRKPRPTVKGLDRSALSKKYSVPVNADKVQAAAQSVQQLAQALGGMVTTNSHPFDILKKGVGIEVKRFMPGHKNLKATVHPDSKQHKIDFATKNNLKRLWLVVHDTSTPGKEGWYARRMGNKGDPWTDPKDPRPGWAYNTRKMFAADSPEGLKEKIK